MSLLVISCGGYHIEFITGLWTHISDHLEKNHTKKEVSRNEPFSEHNIKKEKQLLTLFFFMSNYLIIVHTFVTLKT